MILPLTVIGFGLVVLFAILFGTKKLLDRYAMTNKEPVHFYHIRLLSPKRPGFGALTLAIQFEGDNAVFGYALCSPKDQFSRRVGRANAMTMLESNPRDLPNSAFDYENVASATAHAILYGPSWTKHYRFAQPWRLNANQYAQGTNA